MVLCDSFLRFLFLRFFLFFVVCMALGRYVKAVFFVYYLDQRSLLLLKQVI